MFISKDIIYAGVNDHKIDLFEGQFSVPLGMAYNSYVITDEKPAVMDAVEKNFADEWLNNVEKALNGVSPAYLIIQHMEPDHSSSITAFMEKYPDAVIVSSAAAFKMMANFYKNDYPERRMIIANGGSLSLGRHKLNFISAPMVHWPEVMMTYEETEKVLFSADAFGKFGANDVTDPEGWACEARRYYFGIVGKFGVQVQAVLKKAANLDIKTICSLHGPVLNENLGYYLNLYDIWSGYGVEDNGVVISYTSVYGNTEKAAKLLKEKLTGYGVTKVVLNDLAREDIYECVEDAFRYGKQVFATTTYNGGVFPKMKEFIDHLTERNYQKRTVGFIENGSWAPVATNCMKNMLSNCKDITYAENTVKIFSSLSDESASQIDALAKELAK